MSDLSPNAVIGDTRRFRLPFNGYVLGGMLFGLSAVVGVLGVVIIVKSLVGDFGDYERVDVPGSGEVTIEEADTYRVFYEGEVCDDVGDTTSCDSFSVAPPTLIPVEGGDPLELEPDSGFNYDYSGHEGVEVWRFRVEEPGDFELAMADVPPDVTSVAVGKTPSVDRSGIMLALVFAPTLGLAGLAAIVVTIVVRGRRRRDAAPPTAPPSAWGAPPPTWGTPTPAGTVPPQGTPPPPP